MSFNELQIDFISKIHTPIFLIGMMGSGKTTIGKSVAKTLGWQFIDTDFEIEKQEKMVISEIFSNYGEDYFRNAEKTLLLSLVNAKKTIISCGGGVFTKQENIDLINKNCISVFLNVNLDILKQRLKNDTKRPILKTGKTIDGIFAERLGFYKQAKVAVEIQGQGVQTNTKRCIENLYNHLQGVIYV